MRVTDIKDPSVAYILQYQKSEAEKNVSEKTSGSASGIPEEKVALSDKAKEALQMKAILNGEPEIREEKVQAVKEQVEKGTYSASAEDIAKKIVGEGLLDLFA